MKIYFPEPNRTKKWIRSPFATICEVLAFILSASVWDMLFILAFDRKIKNSYLQERLKTVIFSEKWFHNWRVLFDLWIFRSVLGLKYTTILDAIWNYMPVKVVVEFSMLSTHEWTRNANTKLCEKNFKPLTFNSNNRSCVDVYYALWHFLLKNEEFLCKIFCKLI